MLAEGRRKQKWSTDPRNLTWTNDDSRFGVKLMKKMGWERGKGLGMNEDGSVNAVKASLKTDSRGLGFTRSQERDWTAHQDDFSALLSQLNDSAGNNKNDENATAVSNLEQKSKSQKGIYYKKFAKGKNLSLYKAEDMNAIFGTVVAKSEESDDTEAACSEKTQVENTRKRKNSTKKSESKRPKHKDAEFIVTSQYSVAEYFAMRKAKALNKKVGNIDEKTSPSDAEQTIYGESKTEQSVVKSEKKVKLKKKKKNKEKKSKKIKQIPETAAAIECKA